MISNASKCGQSEKSHFTLTSDMPCAEFPSSEERIYGWQVIESINKCDPDIRRELFSSVMVSLVSIKSFIQLMKVLHCGPDLGCLCATFSCWCDLGQRSSLTCVICGFCTLAGGRHCSYAANEGALGEGFDGSKQIILILSLLPLLLRSLNLMRVKGIHLFNMPGLLTHDLIFWLLVCRRHHKQHV